jgi:uncharacterized protein YndB with AHSA1/START domain
MASAAAVQEVPQTDGGFRLEMTRVIKAPQARVFDAWIRPETIRMWFGPKNMKASVAETNPVVNGNYMIEMQGMCPAGEALRPNESADYKTGVSGTYTKVSPYDLLQFTWAPLWAPDDKSMVTLYFREVAGGTELRLVHDRFSTEAMRDGHNHGWTGSMEKLAALLEV